MANSMIPRLLSIGVVLLLAGGCARSRIECPDGRKFEISAMVYEVKHIPISCEEIGMKSDPQR